ncbi:MAG: hypothetical protein VW935_06560 [Novosphingobium sp.]|jgi:hypothetical protein
MQTARPLDELYTALSGALDDLDYHGEAMAALHLAMAVDCLKACIEGEEISSRASSDNAQRKSHPHLRLVASS